MPSLWTNSYFVATADTVQPDVIKKYIEEQKSRRDRSCEKAYKYRLYPTKEQAETIRFTLERCRLLYNRLPDKRRFTYETDKTTLNYYDQANTLNERKKHVPALNEVHSQVLQDVVKRLDKAFQAFFRRVDEEKHLWVSTFKISRAI